MQIDDFLQLVRARRSIRRFKPDPIPDEYVTKILEAARWAMSGANGQPWEFVVVKDAKVKEKLLDIYQEQRREAYELEQTRVEDLRQPIMTIPPTNPPSFRDAPVIIVVAGDPRVLQATVMAPHFLSGEGWNTFYQNLANTTQNIHLAAAALGLGAQWVSVDYPTNVRINALLDIPDNFKTYNLVPIGYPAYKPPTPWRRELNEMVHFDKFDRSRAKTARQVVDYIRNLRVRTRGTYDIVKGP